MFYQFNGTEMEITVWNVEMKNYCQFHPVPSNLGRSTLWCLLRKLALGETLLQTVESSSNPRFILL